MKTAPSTSQAHKTRWPVHCWHKGMSRIERPCPHHEPKKDSSLRQTTQTLMWEPQLQLFASGKLCWKENQPSLSRPILKGERVSCSVVSTSLQPHGPSVHGILQVSILEWVAMNISRVSS